MIGLQELKKVCRKDVRDPLLLSNIFWRPLSIHGTWLFARLGLSSTVASVLSLVAGLAGGILLAVRTPTGLFLGLGLLQVWYYLDHVDGELARYEQKVVEKPASPAGAYLDLIVHRYVQPFMHFCLGFGLTLSSGSPWYSMLGFWAAFAYTGFARTEGTCIAFSAVRRENDLIRHPGTRHLEALGNLSPRLSELRRPQERALGYLKHLKTVLAHPGNLFLLFFVVAFDFWGPGVIMNWPIPLNATALYLALTALMGLAQASFGTIHVYHILKTLSRHAAAESVHQGSHP